MELIIRHPSEVLSGFVNSYGNLLDMATYTDKTIYLTLLRPEENQQNDPLCSYANIVGLSQEICDCIGLATTEIYAMIAHEIGHILDSRNKDRIPREIVADSLAVTLGLKTALISGLRKLIDSNNYPDESRNMEGRIKVLEEYTD